MNADERLEWVRRKQGDCKNKYIKKCWAAQYKIERKVLKKNQSRSMRESYLLMQE